MADIKKNIVFLRLNPNAIGGAQNYLLRLKNELKSAGINSTIRSFKKAKFLPNFIYPSWLKALLFNAFVKKTKSCDELYFSLERVTCAEIYRAGDGVHRKYRTLKPFWFLNPLNFVYPYLEKHCFNFAKLIITNSNMIKREITEFYGIDESKIITIYNGINLPQNINKTTAKLSLEKEFHITFDKNVILFVGSGFKRKGLAEFLLALSKLKSEYIAIIVGKDKNNKKYKNLAKKLKVNTIFTGQRKDVNTFYEASDLFVLPTHYEPFSNVILEAMSYENAVITTAQNGASEILDQNFVLNAPNDEKCAILIDKLLNNQALLKSTQSQNAKIAQHFSIAKNAKLTLKAINACIY